MPRKKPLPKYVVIKGGKWYIRKKFPDLKYPVWRICRDQTQAGADAVLARLESEIHVAVSEETEPHTVDSFFDHWLESLEDRVQPRTLQDYAWMLRRYVRPTLGSRSIIQLSAEDLRKLLQEMKKQGLSPRTRRFVFVLINAALKKAVEWKLLEENPAEAVTAPKAQKKETPVMTKEQARAFFSACAEAPRGIVFEFALETGMRPEEYLALRWSDVNLDNCTSSVARALVFNKGIGGGFYFGPTKTAASRRTVKFSSRLRDRLLFHRERQLELLSEMQLMDEFSLVFPSTSFTPMSSSNLGKRYLKPMLKDLGLPDHFNLYTLRHTTATLLLGKVNPKIVAERLGSSVEMILKTYSHVLPDMQQAAADEMESALYPQAS